MNDPTGLPEVRRVSYADHANDAAKAIVPDDPDRAGLAAREACRLEPLQKIQVEFDQLVGIADARRRGEPWQHSGDGYPGHVRSAFEYVNRLAAVLETAAKASRTMIDAMESRLSELEAAMKKKAKSDAPDAPKLTASGEPHPLQEGGYDANADPQLPGYISDVEALKEGKTTRKQAEAIAASDAMHGEDQEPTPADPADAAEIADDDEPDEHGKPKAKKPKGKK
jgi:hypothetical protein